MTLEQETEFKQVLTDLQGGWHKVKDLPEKIKLLEAAPEQLALQKAEIIQLRTDLDNHRRAALKMRIMMPPEPGKVSEDCARHLGGVMLYAALRQGHVKGDRFEGLAREILGLETKAALTASDIPLPVEYSGEVVKLVSLFGTARRYGTVFPMPGLTVKLPQLTTDTAFGLIAMSAAVTEKSPAFAFVTFTAEKYGGLIRLPSELDEDSIVPMGQFIANYAARQLAAEEDKVFWTGNGTTDGDPEGLTISTITNSKVTQMAGTKTHYSDATLANLRTLRSGVHAAVLRKAAYFMNPTFEAHLSTFNTGGDRAYNPMVQLSTGGYPVAGDMGPTLDGFPIRWIDTLPAFSTSVNVSKVFNLFGDPSYQYLGTRGGIRFDTSSDAAFATDEILIRALERFTIGLMNNNAVVGLETAAS